MLELNPKPDVATQARKVVKFADTNNTDAHQLNYDDKNPFVVCGISMTPIYKGSDCVTCGLCGASYLREYAKQICAVCNVGSIGADVTGLQLIPNQRK